MYNVLRLFKTKTKTIATKATKFGYIQYQKKKSNGYHWTNVSLTKTNQDYSAMVQFRYIKIQLKSEA